MKLAASGTLCSTALDKREQSGQAINFSLSRLSFGRSVGASIHLLIRGNMFPQYVHVMFVSHSHAVIFDTASSRREIVSFYFSSLTTISTEQSNRTYCHWRFCFLCFTSNKFTRSRGKRKRKAIISVRL